MRLSILTAAFLICYSLAWGTADGPDFWQTVDKNCDTAVVIHAEPGDQAEPVGAIPPGATCIRNLGCQGGLTLQEYQALSETERAARMHENPRWCRIEFGGVVGWVDGRLLAEGDCDPASAKRAVDAVAGWKNSVDK